MQYVILEMDSIRKRVRGQFVKVTKHVPELVDINL